MNYTEILKKYSDYIELVNLSCNQIIIGNRIYDVSYIDGHKDFLLFSEGHTKKDCLVMFKSEEELDKALSAYCMMILNNAWTNVKKTMSKLIKKLPTYYHLTYDRKPTLRYSSKNFCCNSMYLKLGKQKIEVATYIFNPISFEDFVNGCADNEQYGKEIYSISWKTGYSININPRKHNMKYLIPTIENCIKYKLKEHSFERSVRREEKFFSDIELKENKSEGK